MTTIREAMPIHKDYGGRYEDITVLAWSANYVYSLENYDGAEYIAALPRAPYHNAISA